MIFTMLLAKTFGSSFRWGMRSGFGLGAMETNRPEDLDHEPGRGPELTGASRWHGEEEEALWRHHGPEALGRYCLGDGLLQSLGPGVGPISGPADPGPEEEEEEVEAEEDEEEDWSWAMYGSSSEDHDEQVADQRYPEQVPAPSELTSDAEVVLGAQRLMAFAMHIQRRSTQRREASDPWPRCRVRCCVNETSLMYCSSSSSVFTRLLDLGFSTTSTCSSCAAPPPS